MHKEVNPRNRLELKLLVTFIKFYFLEKKTTRLGEGEGWGKNLVIEHF